jgi:hypothetical protein
MHRSCIEKRISKVVWETLSTARHADEKLAWDGEESEDDHFFTPPQSSLKEDNDCNVVLSTQSHLEVNGLVHNVIMEKPTNLELFHYLRSSRSEHSNAK